MTPVGITLFGPLTVERDGASIAAGPGRRPEELLTYLLLGGQDSYDRRTLAQFFLPDADEEQALRLMRQHLHLLQVWLRDDVGRPELIDVSRQQITLDRSGMWVDVLEVERVWAAVQAHQHRYQPTCAECLAQIGAVLSSITVQQPGRQSTSATRLYRDWYATRLADARRVLMQLIELLTRQALRHGAYERGLDLARQQVVIDATNERAQRAVMSFLAVTGRLGEALRQYDVLRRLLKAQHDLDPEPATLLLVERIRTRQFVLERRSNDVEPLPELIGRDAELARARVLITSGEERLLTVVGLGGVGKTLFAQTLARRLADSFEEGNVVIRLESVTDAAAMLEQIAAAVGCLPNMRQPLALQLAQFLARRDLLLILDNLEQVEGAAEALHALLQGTQQPVFVVTSRRPVGLLRESLLRLSGLSLAADGVPGAAEQLFLALARRYDQQRNWTDELPAIAAICRLCDGLPLALELAAYRARSQSATDVLEQIGRDLTKLHSDLLGPSPRRASVVLVLAESWAQCRPAVQQVLVAAACFLSPFSQEALRAVAGAVMDEADVADALRDARELGFVSMPRLARYRLHPLVHQFLAARTAESPALADRLWRAYAAYLSNLLQQASLYFVNTATRCWAAAQSELQVEVIAAWRILLETEQYDRLTATAYPLAVFAAAGDWVLRCDDLLAETLPRLGPTVPAECRLRLLAIRVYLYISHQDARRVEPVLTEMLQEPLPQPLRAEHALALRQRGTLASTRGRYEAADADLLRSCDFVPDPALPVVTASPDGSLGLNAIWQGDLERGERYVLAGLVTARRLGDQRTEIANLNNLGLASVQRKDYAAALARFTEGLQVTRSIGDRPTESVLLGNVGAARVMLGDDLDRALSDLQAAADISREMGVRGYLRTNLAAIGDTTFRAGRLSVAVTYLAEVVLLDLELGAVPTTAERFVQLCEALHQLGRTTMLSALVDAGQPWWRGDTALTARVEQLMRLAGSNLPAETTASLDSKRLGTLIELACPLPGR